MLDAGGPVYKRTAEASGYLGRAARRKEGVAVTELCRGWDAGELIGSWERGVAFSCSLQISRTSDGVI